MLWRGLGALAMFTALLSVAVGLAFSLTLAVARADDVASTSPHADAQNGSSPSQSLGPRRTHPPAANTNAAATGPAPDNGSKTGTNNHAGDATSPNTEAVDPRGPKTGSTTGSASTTSPSTTGSASTTPSGITAGDATSLNEGDVDLHGPKTGDTNGSATTTPSGITAGDATSLNEGDVDLHGPKTGDTNGSATTTPSGTTTGDATTSAGTATNPTGEAKHPHGPKTGSTIGSASTTTPPSTLPADAIAAVSSIRSHPNAVSATTATTAAVAAPTTSLTVGQKITQLVHQAIGLASDLSLIAISVVNNLAAVAAASIGREPFWGLPYDVATTIVKTTATVGQLLTGSPLTPITGGLFPVTYGILNALGTFTPQTPPPGANDPSITVTAAHPLPIILINGTGGSQGNEWSVGAPVLANAGYKVFTFNYGNITSDPNYPLQSTGDIPTSAAELATEVNTVLAQTGAPKVILVGLSQGGGILPNYYINNLGGDAVVSQLIGISPSNHGTDFDGLVYLKNFPILGPLILGALAHLGPAFLQQAIGSPLEDQTYGHGDTRPGVLYTTLSSTDDWVVTPYAQQALTGPNVTNIIMQDQYPGLLASHIGLAFVSPTWDTILGALAANPAANPQEVSSQPSTIAA